MVETARTQTLIESDDFPIEFVSQLAEAESWRKEVYRPVYHVHKWWAKRLGSVFRAVLLGTALRPEQPLADSFYRKHDFRGVTVFDPFMGSGTTIGEAHKLGFTALGRDINPVAVESVRVALGPLDGDALTAAFRALSAGVGERIRSLYKTHGADGNECDVLYHFWVKTLACPHCAKRVDLFPNYIFARNALPQRKPEAKVICPECDEIFCTTVNAQSATCPACSHSFDPHRGPADGANATCRACEQSFPIMRTVRAQGGPPAHRLYAKLVLSESGEKTYLRATAEDAEEYRRCSEELVRSKLPLPTLELRDGYNTRQALNYGYAQWRQFFNDRQLLALGWLHEAILALPDKTARDAMLAVFSGTLEFNNLFASYKGEGTGAVRHMFSHHILKPERMPIEGNVWGTPKSSGAFSTLFKSRLFRAIEYHAAPFEVALGYTRGSVENRRVYGASEPFSGEISMQWPPPKSSARAIHISCGNSATSGLRARSVDLVVTDPPFFDNVHYSELADFFHAWQSLRSHNGNNPKPHESTRQIGEVQDTDAGAFATKLRAVFVECHRVLKDDGLLVFSYHHSRPEGWTSLAEAVLGAGFTFINAQPTRSELSVAMPKSQTKEPIQFDTLLVCRKASMDFRTRIAPGDAFGNAVRRAKAKAARLRRARFALTAGDCRIILYGQFLAEVSPQLDVPALSDALAAYSELLHTTAENLGAEESEIAPAFADASDEAGAAHQQLVLLESPDKASAEAGR